MDFSHTEEQQMLRDSVARFIKQDYDFDTRRKILAQAPGFSPANWSLFAELGWLAIAFSEADGGLGGSAADIAVLMEELGKGLVVEPFLPTVILGGGLIAAAGSVAQKQALLPGVMEGKVQLAFAFAEAQSRYQLQDVATTATKEGDTYVITGKKAVVLNGLHADTLIVAVRSYGQQGDREGISLLLVDADAKGVSRSGYATVDGHQAAELTFERVKVPASSLLGEEGAALPVMERVIDRAALAVCAEAVGAMEVAFGKTVEYSRIRKQFGVAIGSFQALQHRMVEMFMEHQQAKSILLMAAMKCDSAGGNDPRAISAMKSRIGKAARLIGQEAVQIHGGIGVTEELDVGHYFKRLTTIQYLFGSTDFHTRRFATL
jgi:alkylation response protein AidB-like acyl-CoA dehydrogenase